MLLFSFGSEAGLFLLKIVKNVMRIFKLIFFSKRDFNFLVTVGTHPSKPSNEIPLGSSIVKCPWKRVLETKRFENSCLRYPNKYYYLCFPNEETEAQKRPHNSLKARQPKG